MATVCPKGATMIGPVRRTGIAAALLVAAMTACRPAPRASSGTGTHDRTVLSQALPAMDGRGLRVTVLEVPYGPGDPSRPHRHPCAAIRCVRAGALLTPVPRQPRAPYLDGSS